MKHHYFISYFVGYAGSAGHGWTDVTMPHPIRGPQDVFQLQQVLRGKAGAESLTITGWQKFED